MYLIYTCDQTPKSEHLFLDLYFPFEFEVLKISQEKKIQCTAASSVAFVF